MSNKKEPATGGELKPKKKSILQWFRDKEAYYKNGINTGGGEVWHRVLMAIILTCVAIFLVASVFAQYLLDQQEEHFKKNPPIYNSEQHTLTPGTYRIFSLSLIDPDHPDENYAVVSDVKGGILIAIPFPKDTKLPENFDVSSYNIVVQDDGTWTFQGTDFLKRIEAYRTQHNEVTK